MEPVNCRFICKISFSHVTLRDGTVFTDQWRPAKKDHGFAERALDFRKLLKYLGSLEKCALNHSIF